MSIGVLSSRVPGSDTTDPDEFDGGELPETPIVRPDQLTPEGKAAFKKLYGRDV